MTTAAEFARTLASLAHPQRDDAEVAELVGGLGMGGRGDAITCLAALLSIYIDNEAGRTRTDLDVYMRLVEAHLRANLRDIEDADNDLIHEGGMFL